MRVNQTLKTIFIGTAVGSLASVVNGASDALLVPLLVFFGIEPTFLHAIGTSLAALLPPVTAGGAYKYYTKGFVNIKTAIILAVTMAISMYVASGFVVNRKESDIRRIHEIFGISLIILGIYIIFQKPELFKKKY